MNLLCTILGVFCTAGAVSGPAYVHDGDTLYIAHRAYRLAGIDAEELDEPHGMQARDHLRQLVAGRIVTCRWDGWSYNRRVAVCFDIGIPISLNAQMIRDGYALDCFFYSRGQYRQLEPMGARSRLIQKPYC